MPATEQYFTIPNLLEDWPFVHEPNPQQHIAAESVAWVESWNVFDKKAQDVFNCCQFGLLGLICFPKARDNYFRICVDIINLLFVCDEQNHNQSEAVVVQQNKDIMDALREPNNPGYEGETVLGPITREFWKRTLECASHSSAQRCIRDFDIHTDAVRQEAADRDCKRIHNIEGYIQLRRGTIAGRLFFDFYLLPDDLPEEVLVHPAIEALTVGAIDMTIFQNDIYSFNVEQSHDDGEHNLVSVTMIEKGCTVQEAMDYLADLYKELARQFMAGYKNLPRFPEPVNDIVQEYCWALGHWHTANTEWSFLSERYFGKESASVMVHRKLKLLPKKH